MSKMDNLRAMREARYDRAVARASQASRPPPIRLAEPSTPAARIDPVEAQPATSETTPDEEPCGHRNMSGRHCTREKGHSAKSHRYS
jgi:hypothetical protein